MLHPSTKRLIEKLDEMTRKQRVAWEESDNGAVTHDTEGYRVVLTPAPHAMVLTDALGREIETCGPDDLAGETDATGRPFAEFLGDLYREAHRHARGAEKAISVLLSSLDAAEPVIEEAETFEHVEDEGDDSMPIEGDLPEVEGEEDMQKAVAAMADQLNGGEQRDAVTAAKPEVTERTAEAPLAPEPVRDTLQPTAPVDTYAPFAGSPEDATAYAVSGNFETPAPFAEAPASQPEAGPEPEASEALSEDNDVWNAIRNAGTAAPDKPAEPDLDFAAKPQAKADADRVTDAEPPADPTARPAPVFGSGFFSGGGMSDLSRYKTEPPPAPAPTPVPEQAEPAAEAAQSQPAAEPAPVLAQPRHFSLSGITSGFGLGATHPAARSQPTEPALSQADAAPSETPARKIIDGTVDLPDALPESPSSPGYRMEEDTEFGFSDVDMMPGVEASPLPATPVPPGVPATSESTQNSPAAEGEGEHRVKPSRRFNPWN